MGSDAAAGRYVALRDGVRVWLHTGGDPAAPVTVVLLHGWTLNSRLWQHQYAPLHARPGIRTIAYDMRGHGRSDPTSRDACTLATTAEDLTEVLDATGPHGTVVLVGHSMGGMTIMEYAHLHPDDFGTRIGGVVLVATAADKMARDGAPWLGRAENLGYRIMVRAGQRHWHRAVAPALSVGMRTFVFGPDAPPPAVRLATSMITQARLLTIGAFHPTLLTHQRLASLGPLDRVPTVILAGCRDRLTPPDRSERMAAALPAARYLPLPGAGHMLPLERPAEVTDAIVGTVAAAAAAAVDRPADAGTDRPADAVDRPADAGADRPAGREASTGPLRAPERPDQ